MPEENQGEHAPARFATTHWSWVAAAGTDGSPAASAALERLCQVYWYPLYAFIRRLGRSPQDAQDLTQGFFAYIMQRGLVAKANRQAGRFRSFLLASLQHFLAHEHERATAQKRGGGRSLIEFDALEPEARYALEPLDLATPEVLFDRRWALQQIENALQRLRAEYAATDRVTHFDLLRDFVWGNGDPLTVGEIATRLSSTEDAVRKAAQRLRHRFRQHLREEIAQTVASPDKIDDELYHLRSALAGHE